MVKPFVSQTQCEGFDPHIMKSNSVLPLSFNQFRAYQVGFLEEYKICVDDIICIAANYLGGIHHGLRNSKKNKTLLFMKEKSIKHIDDIIPIIGTVYGMTHYLKTLYGIATIYLRGVRGFYENLNKTHLMVCPPLTFP